MSAYLVGVDVVLGARTKQTERVVGASPASAGRGVLITVRDVPALVKSQGGASGAFVNWLVPDTIETTVYGRMADEIAAGMKEKGVDADVRVVQAAGFKKSKTPDFTNGVLVGAGAVGVGWLAWKLLKGLL